MTFEQELLSELREIRNLLNGLQSDANKMARIPEASRILKINRRLLSSLCKEGKIPCSPVTKTSKQPQYLVDVVGARKVLLSGKHLIQTKSKT